MKLAVGGRRHVLTFPETAVEICQVGKTGLGGNRADGAIGSDQLRADVTDAQVVDEVEKTPPGRAAKITAERGRAESCHSCSGLQC